MQQKVRKLVQLYIAIASYLVKYFAGKLANYITSDTWYVSLHIHVPASKNAYK